VAENMNAFPTELMFLKEIWTLRKVDLKYLERFEMWCGRRLEKVSWPDLLRN
jgi:hypothetical protein